MPKIQLCLGLAWSLSPGNLKVGGEKDEHRWLQYSMISIMIGEIKGTIGSALNKNAP